MQSIVRFVIDWPYAFASTHIDNTLSNVHSSPINFVSPLIDFYHLFVRRQNTIPFSSRESIGEQKQTNWIVIVTSQFTINSSSSQLMVYVLSTRTLPPTHLVPLHWRQLIETDECNVCDNVQEEFFVANVSPLNLMLLFEFNRLCIEQNWFGVRARPYSGADGARDRGMHG